MGLTATVPRTVIDLTDAISSTASPPRDFSDRDERPALDEGPPLKRRRIENEETQKLKLKVCLQAQVLPHVSNAVRELPSAIFLVDDIAIATVTTLAKSSTFREGLERSDEFELLPEDEAKIKAQAELMVLELAGQPLYQIAPTTSSDPTDISTVDDNTAESSQVAATTSSDTSNATTANQGAEIPQLALVLAPKILSPETVAPKIKTEDPVLELPPIKLEATYVQRRTRYKPRARTSDPPPATSKWFQLRKRPYLVQADRENIARGARNPVLLSPDTLQEPTVYHVDFTHDEVSRILSELKKYLPETASLTLESLWQFCLEYPVPSIIGDQIPGRSIEDIRNFCSDLLATQTGPPSEGRVLSLERNQKNHKSNDRRDDRLPSLLLAREMNGNAGFGRMRRYENFQNELRKSLEDGLSLVSEFTNCAGDISTVSWVPNDNIICGTTAHSDTHNQQYNKQGNLVLCSTSLGTLRAFPDHRIPRPLVEKGENSTFAMRQSQEPWLYSSVVSSDYDEIQKRAYTSSFDRTVKIWNVSEAGDAMEAIATWHLQGNVNFVAAAKDGSGRVAAAADVPTEAVRVYTVNENNLAESPYQAFSCSRSDANGSDKWAYFPATLQWGKAPRTRHLLVVGYSPRGLSHDDLDIPEDKRNSGEITLWDANQGCRIPVLTATTANVFEVTWHPTLPRFIVATSPCGLNVKTGVRTQIHLFQRDNDRPDGAYSEFQSLDCSASDINELTFMPNSLRHAYVTASCTDGKVYVWDTSQGDIPIHILKHGHPVDDYNEDREKEDTGVKFSTWGITLDRFYTGSSDGVVKVWNIRNTHKPFVRDLLEAPGPISCGAFSPDSSKLVIGDATGRVFLFSVDSRDEPQAHFITLPGTNRRLRRPKPFIPHTEPPPPKLERDPNTMEVDENTLLDTLPIDVFARRKYLDSQQVVLTPNPVIGAVQGPQYASTGLFRREAHLDEDPTGPLMTAYERNQRESLESSRGMRQRCLRRVKDVGVPEGEAQTRHVANTALDLDVESLEEGELTELVRAGAELTIHDVDWGFEYEDMPAETASQEELEEERHELQGKGSRD